MSLKRIRRQRRFLGFTGNVLLPICLKLYTIALVFEQIQSMTFAQGMGGTTLVQKYSKASLAAIVSKEFA